MIWLKAMVLGVALTPAIALAQAPQPDIANMTDEQITALPDDVLMGLPALEAYGRIVGANPVEFTVAIEEMLHRLYFYQGIPTGTLNADLDAAIFRFQASVGAEPTGILLLGEFEELTWRANQTEIPEIRLPRFLTVFSIDGLALASGTWVAQDFEMDWPVQTSQIRCNFAAADCTEVTARITERDGAAASLDLEWVSWVVISWSSAEIVAEDDTLPCILRTLILSIETDRVFEVRQGKLTEECAGVSQEAFIFELMNGAEISQDQGVARRDQIRDFLDPRVTTILRSVFE
jgi:hypothetical protein